MADVSPSLKRHRDTTVHDGESENPETHISDTESDPKKHKSLNQILSILEQDEDVSDTDLSTLISSLENEISCTIDFDTVLLPKDAGVDAASSSEVSKSLEEEVDEEERVIRHLLEASDDELGLPASKISTDEIGDGVVINGGDSFGFCEGLWELEDEAANYYTLLQSELFM